MLVKGVFTLSSQEHNCCNDTIFFSTVLDLAVFENLNRDKIVKKGRYFIKILINLSNKSLSFVVLICRAIKV